MPGNNRYLAVLRSDQQRRHLRERVGTVGIQAEELSVPRTPVATSRGVERAARARQPRIHPGHRQGRGRTRLLSLRPARVHELEPRDSH